MVGMGFVGVGWRAWTSWHCYDIILLIAAQYYDLILDCDSR